MRVILFTMHRLQFDDVNENTNSSKLTCARFCHWFDLDVNHGCLCTGLGVLERSIGAPPKLLIAGFGTVLFVAMSFVDFYTMPRRYSDDQYLAGALGMYLTYINLFVFILRLMIALNGGGRRD